VNAGHDPAGNLSLELSLRQEAVLCAQTYGMLTYIAAGDTLFLEMSLESVTCGWHTLTATLDDPHGALPDDNRIDRPIFLSCQSPLLLLNELMPLPFSEDAEWLELYNCSDQLLDIRGWLLSDKSRRLQSITDSTLLVAPRTWLVIGGKSGRFPDTGTAPVRRFSGFPVLNNDADALFLFDPQGIPVDSMFYTNASTLQTGRSLERIRWNAPGGVSSNWSNSIAASGATPGSVNSLHLEILPNQINIRLQPNPFTPDGDGQADEVRLDFELPVEQGLITVLIYDTAGRRIAEPYRAQPVSHRGQLYWDGTANYGGIAVSGLYICRILIEGQPNQLLEVLRKIYLIR
jgi:hypothetical protein